MVRNDSERKEYCTLTVREVARLFEAAGVARTERSIINWCQPSKMGVARLDNYFDPNERKYFISPQSVQLAIHEENAKSAKPGEAMETPGGVPNHSEKHQRGVSSDSEADPERVQQLETRLLQLEAPESEAKGTKKGN